MTAAPTPPTPPDPDTRPDWSIPNATTLAEAHAGRAEIAATLAGREGVVMP